LSTRSNVQAEPEMKLLIIFLVMSSLFYSATTALCLDLNAVPWNEVDLRTLQTATPQDVVDFMKSDRAQPDHWSGAISFDGDISGLSTYHTRDFKWVNLAGGTEYQLAVAVPPLGSSGVNSLIIFNKDFTGQTTANLVSGVGVSTRDIRDLNGDGKKQLIITDGYETGPAGAGVYWPKVYTYAPGSITDSSKKFEAYYDKEVLPKLSNKIARFEAEAVKKSTTYQESEQQRMLQDAIKERSEILKLLGRRAN